MSKIKIISREDIEHLDPIVIIKLFRRPISYDTQEIRIYIDQISLRLCNIENNILIQGQVLGKDWGLESDRFQGYRFKSAYIEGVANRSALEEAEKLKKEIINKLILAQRENSYLDIYII